MKDNYDASSDEEYRMVNIEMKPKENKEKKKVKKIS